MTIMSRLAEKGLLVKEKEGPAFQYRPVVSREDFRRIVASDVISVLLDGFGKEAFSRLIEETGKADPEIIAELERLIEERKKQRQVGRVSLAYLYRHRFITYTFVLSVVLAALLGVRLRLTGRRAKVNPWLFILPLEVPVLSYIVNYFSAGKTYAVNSKILGWAGRLIRGFSFGCVVTLGCVRRSRMCWKTPPRFSSPRAF